MVGGAGDLAESVADSMPQPMGSTPGAQNGSICLSFYLLVAILGRLPLLLLILHPLHDDWWWQCRETHVVAWEDVRRR